MSASNSSISSRNQQVPRLQNSYRLDSKRPFNIEKVERILKEVLVEAMENLTYDPEKVSVQAKWASGVMRERVKELDFDRYKIVCVVSIGEKRSHDVYSVMRFLWDAERDKFAKCVHENMYLFGIALCFGIYYE